MAELHARILAAAIVSGKISHLMANSAVVSAYSLQRSVRMVNRRGLLILVLLVFSSFSVASAIAPGVPQNLTATVSGNNVTFAWQAPSTAGVPSGYVLEAALSPGGVPIASLPVTTSPLTVPSVPNGIYYVAVRGLNSDGSGERSNELVVSVPSGGGGSGCTSAPGAPTNLTTTASGNLVTLTWAAPSSGCPATSYVVQAGSAPGASNLAVVNVGNTLSLSASAPSGTYYIRIVATNAYGSAATSDSVLAVATTPTPAPTPTPTPPPSNRVRIGAVCRDGSLSSATGSGACSSHGGVSCWRYSDNTCTMPDERDPFEVAAWMRSGRTAERGEMNHDR